MSHQGEDKLFRLPASLVTRSDLRRLIVEIEVIDNELVTESIHDRIGHESDRQVALSGTLSECIELNDVDIRDQAARTGLLAEIRRLKDQAPVVHMTFATAVKQEILSKLVGWLREKIHPQTVIDVGLQPGLIGGVYVRTTNKVFDMSIRSQLASSRKVIVRDLEALNGLQ